MSFKGKIKLSILIDMTTKDNRSLRGVLVDRSPNMKQLLDDVIRAYKLECIYVLPYNKHDKGFIFLYDSKYRKILQVPESINKNAGKTDG